MKGANFSYLTDDKIVCQGAAYLHGLIIDASADGGDVTIYEGQDPNSGRKIAKFSQLAHVNRPFNLPADIYCQRGIYIDVGSDITGVTVIWSRPDNEHVAV